MFFEYLGGLPLLLAEFDVFGQKVASGDLAVIGLLILLEGVLSIDNALVLGILAKRLPAAQRPRALSYGLIGAFVFRVIAICTASFLLRWTFVKFLGGAYLAYISLQHLLFSGHGDDHEEAVKLDSNGHPIVDVEEAPEVTPEVTPEVSRQSFWGTVAVIELTDVAFAVDSILAAMALAGSRPEKLWVVVSGGIIGVVLMRFAAAVFIKLLERFPRFEMTAYLLVLVIGVKLLADWGVNSDWSCREPAWFAKSLGTWQPTMEGIEQKRIGVVNSYESWLEKNWIFKIPAHGHHQTLPDAHNHEGSAEKEPGKEVTEAPVATEAGTEKEPKQMQLPNAPHLLDFHDLRRPECMSFWILMAVFLGCGFLPESKKPVKAKEEKKEAAPPAKKK